MLPPTNARGVVDIHGLVTVFVHGIFQTGTDGIQCFLPGYTLKFTFTAFAHALHGVIQAIRMIDPSTD